LFNKDCEELSARTELDEFRLSVELVGVNNCLTQHANHICVSIFIRGDQQRSARRKIKRRDVVVALDWERLRFVAKNVTS
jgi:hypothetical protein